MAYNAGIILVAIIAPVVTQTAGCVGQSNKCVVMALSDLLLLGLSSSQVPCFFELNFTLLRTNSQKDMYVSKQTFFPLRACTLYTQLMNISVETRIGNFLCSPV